MTRYDSNGGCALALTVFVIWLAMIAAAVFVIANVIKFVLGI